jgi:heme-degrading monooxygenase HmoA
MSNYLASGNWHVTEGKEDEFIERWTRFLKWTRETQPGLEAARLIRADTHPNRFVSFAEWRDADARATWRAAPEWAEMHQACKEVCDDFEGGDFEAVVTI